MPQHHKVDDLLSESELEELMTFAREPGRTIDECHQWMLERGFNIGRTAVGNWKQKFDQRLMGERLALGELARAIKGAVKEGEFGDVADAAVMQLTQVVFEQAASLQAEGKLDSLDVQRMTRSLVNLVGSKAGLTKLLAAKFDRQVRERQEKRPGGAITQEDIDAVRKAVFG